MKNQKLKARSFMALKVLLPVFLLVAAYLAFNQGVSAENGSAPSVTSEGVNLEGELTIRSAQGARHRFTIELALRPEEQAKGLMFRQSMPKDHGMLFVFGSNRERSFWMKNTLIPLDIIFLEQDGRIQHIHSMAKPQDLTGITSGLPSYAVLEINGGLSHKLGIKVGDYVHHTAFRNRNLEYAD
ncbi:MAG: DUF192 domain-containing protein [Alphaproteobacteria bacterium]